MKSYLGLTLRFPLLPITGDEQLDRALAAMDSLLDKKKLNEYEQGYLDVLRALIAEYERKKYPMKALSPVDLLKALIEDHGLKYQDLAKQIGVVPSAVSDILNGRRRINVRHAKALSHRFKMRVEAFL